MKPDLPPLTLFEALDQLRRQEYSTLELIEACLHRIERLNPVINAFITPTPELAVQGALQADILINKRPSNLNDLALLGLPVGIKDLIDVAGVPCTAGSKFFSKGIPAEDAPVVQKLKLSGAVILGKTNTHEIALGVTGINPHYGAVKNPWDLARITGGSSSGSAAAVASGMCLAAIGTDTGGSTRIPAALCGVVGFKPTYGRISTRGVIPLSWSLDHIGTITHTVRDAGLMLAAMAGFDAHDPASVNIPMDDYILPIQDGIRNWRIALSAGEYIEAADNRIMSGFDGAAQVFKSLGARLEKTDLSWLKELALANGQITLADAAAFHRERLMEHPDWFGSDVLQRLQNGAALSSSEYALARKIQAEGRRRFEMFFEKFDILLIPSTPVPAPTIDGTEALHAARQLTRFTAAFNLTGLPAMSVPCGFTEAGLPIGLQIVSRHWGESKVLQAGYAFEQATNWHERVPNI
jgi:aspartyl-tRNA(Asn)/glutamyl-tRNA(Gln) amidotransferase subunit A